jgi:hypothetical protein
VPKEIWPWEQIESEFLAGKWKTLGEISKAYGISIGMVEKRSTSRKWSVLKKELKLRTREKVMEVLAEDNAEIIRRARAEIIEIADLLISQGRIKFKDAKGNTIERSINGVPTAVNALNIGAKLKMQALGMTRGGDGESESPVNFINNGEINFKELSDADLDRFINTATRKLAEMGGPSWKRKTGPRKSKKPAA